jgi:hypothetical protein
MQFRICLCCGEPISAQGKSLSRNPNVCVSCSSLLDGEEASTEREPFESNAGDAGTFGRIEEICQAA